MINLDSHITLAVVFSFIAMLGQAVSIYAIIHTRAKEGQVKEVEMTRNFTRLEVKMDTYNSRLDNIDRTVEKSDKKLDEVSNHLTRTDERINNLYDGMDDLRRRVSVLEGKE